MGSSLNIADPNIIQACAVEYRFAPSVHDPDFVVHDLRSDDLKRIIDAVVIRGEGCGDVEQNRPADHRVCLVRAPYLTRYVQGHRIISKPIKHMGRYGLI